MARVVITTSPSFADWIKGMATLPATAGVLGMAEMQAATDVFYDRSQQAVHVLTGHLKGSGDSRVFQESGQIVGEVEYTADYAGFENARGDDHAFMDSAWEASAQHFENMLPNLWGQIVATWGV